MGKIMSTRAPKPVQHPVEAAVRDFEGKRDALKQFMAANDATFTTFNHLVDDYNRTVVGAKGAVRTADDLTNVYTGDFSRSKAPESLVFDVAKLPKKVRDMPGVLGVNDKVLKALIEAKQVSMDDIKGAVTIEIGNPRVNGPKEIEVKVG